MRKSHIPLYIDLLFCLVIMPLAIMLLPVDRWIVHNTAFLITLVLYVYVLYFLYRWVCLPKLFMQKKYLHIVCYMLCFVGMTELLTYFPLPSELVSGVTRPIEVRLHMRTQTIWFFFLVVTGFSLAIELPLSCFVRFFRVKR